VNTELAETVAYQVTLAAYPCPRAAVGNLRRSAACKTQVRRAKH